MANCAAAVSVSYRAVFVFWFHGMSPLRILLEHLPQKILFNFLLFALLEHADCFQGDSAGLWGTEEEIPPISLCAVRSHIAG